MGLRMPSSNWRRRLHQIERQLCRNARPSPTSPKPLQPWPGSSSKQLQDTTGVPGFQWIGIAKQIPSGWTVNTSETWENTSGHTDTVWTSATTVGRVGARERAIGITPQEPTPWEENRTESRGNKDERGSGKYLVILKWIFTTIFELEI